MAEQFEVFFLMNIKPNIVKFVEHSPFNIFFFKDKFLMFFYDHQT